MPVLIIDQKDFLRGLSSFDDTPDGGYSPRSTGINVFSTPGLLKPGPDPVEVAGAVAADGILGWSTWSVNLAPGITRMVAGTGSSAFDGKFYLSDDSAQTTLAATDTAHDYKPGVTNMIRYKGNFYVTSNTDIAMLNFDFSVNDFSYWVTTKGKAALTPNVPHPMVTYADILFIADGRYLHMIDGTTATTQVLILPEDYTISDLELYDGKIYIAASKFTGYSENVPALDARIFTWDSYSASFVDEFPLQDPIESMRVFGGTLVLFSQYYVGYWTGSTVNVLRMLTNRVRRYQISISKDRLYYAQGKSVFCMGNPVMQKTKFFSAPIYYATQDITAIFCHRPGIMMVNSGTKMLNVSDLDAGTGVEKSFYSLKYPLGGYSVIQKVIIESEALAALTNIGLQYIDSEGTVREIGTYSHTAFGAISYHEFDMQIKAHRPTYFYQQIVNFVANPKGIRRIYVIYGPTELPPNK